MSSLCVSKNSSIISFLTLKIITKINNIKEIEKAETMTQYFTQSASIEIIFYGCLLIILIVYLLLVKKLEH